jgi:molybdopterin/thiamine biosynthesis adenylyltransferase
VQFLASIGATCPVWLVDGDSYVESNHGRALFHSYGNKACVKAAELNALAPGGPTIVTVPRYVTPRNVWRLIEEGDIVLLCVDNHKSRKCLSNAAGKLRDVLVISGGNDGTDQRSGAGE